MRIAIYIVLWVRHTARRRCDARSRDDRPFAFASKVPTAAGSPSPPPPHSSILHHLQKSGLLHIPRSRNGNRQFSPTVIESNSARLKNHRTLRRTSCISRSFTIRDVLPPHRTVRYPASEPQDLQRNRLPHRFDQNAQSFPGFT